VRRQGRDQQVEQLAGAPGQVLAAAHQLRQLVDADDRGEDRLSLDAKWK
jgi:hypothetical protein